MMEGMMKKGAVCACPGGAGCGCPHHKVGPLFVVLFGVLFLLGNLGVVDPSMVSATWPLLVILAGLFKMFKGKCGCC